MVCTAASGFAESGCGCRLAGPPKMEHDGINGIGKWHVVNVPHSTCRGAFHPMTFRTECSAATCACPELACTQTA